MAARAAMLVDFIAIVRVVRIPATVFVVYVTVVRVRAVEIPQSVREQLGPGPPGGADRAGCNRPAQLDWATERVEAPRARAFTAIVCRGVFVCILHGGIPFATIRTIRTISADLQSPNEFRNRRNFYRV